MSAAPRTDDEPARQLLVRLLTLAERAGRRGDTRPASLPMTQAKAPAYHHAKSWAEREHFHAAIELARRDGAIEVDWQPHRDDPLLLCLAVADMGALARHLKVDLLTDRIAEAERILFPWRSLFPVIDAVLEHWRQGRRVRSHHCEAAENLAAAAHAVQACQTRTDGDRLLRRESVRLFGPRQSKRLENLTVWLEVLITGDVVASGLDDTQIWSVLGLRREPQPFLLAGTAEIDLDHGDDTTTLVLPRRYLGVAAESLRSVRTPARQVLTIENLTSFHDMARHADGQPVLLLFTGGMPSPTWLAAYTRILRGLPEDVVLMHWGDIDEGGYRIAAKLAAAARETGRLLQPWRMSPDELPVEIRDAAPPASTSTQMAMIRFAERAGWPQVAQAIARNGILVEQEALDAGLPMEFTQADQAVPGNPAS